MQIQLHAGRRIAASASFESVVEKLSQVLGNVSKTTESYVEWKSPQLYAVATAEYTFALTVHFGIELTFESDQDRFFADLAKEVKFHTALAKKNLKSFKSLSTNNQVRDGIAGYTKSLELLAQLAKLK